MHSSIQGTFTPEEDKLWFSEELVLRNLDSELTSSRARARSRRARDTLGIVRVDLPRWEEVPPDACAALTSGRNSSFYWVRLGFQFDIRHFGPKRKARFNYAACYASIEPALVGRDAPSVYDLFPHHMEDGEPRRVEIEVGPQVKFSQVEASIGKLSTSVSVGMVEPVTIGWPGEQERAPYWEIRPKSRSLLGTRHFWLLIEQPSNCDGIKLSVGATCELQTIKGPIPLGPKITKKSSRPFVIIGTDS